MPTSPSGTASLSIPQLRDAIHGRVIAPDDAGYDQMRTVFVGGIDRRPAVIVRATDADADDVSHVVGLARETGLELATSPGTCSRSTAPRPPRRDNAGSPSRLTPSGTAASADAICAAGAHQNRHHGSATTAPTFCASLAQM